jgi:hypothetical protein
VTRRLRPIAAPFVVARPVGARVRTRLPVSGGDKRVLRAVGEQLGTLAGSDLARRGSVGRLDAKARAVSRRERKRGLTAESSSRWQARSPAPRRTPGSSASAISKPRRGACGRGSAASAVGSPCRWAPGGASCVATGPKRSGSVSSDASRCSNTGWWRWRLGCSRPGCRSAGAGGTWHGADTI